MHNSMGCENLSKNFRTSFEGPIQKENTRSAENGKTLFGSNKLGEICFHIIYFEHISYAMDIV